MDTRVRIDKEANYQAVFFEGNTIRQAIDSKKPILMPKNTDIEEIAIQSKERNFDGIVAKAYEIWGRIPENQRPFEVIIGSLGEPTLHPAFVPFLTTIRSLDILPSYITNGLHISSQLIRASEMYTGNVYVRYDTWIKSAFASTVSRLTETDINVHAYLTLDSKQSLVDIQAIYMTFKNHIKSFIITCPTLDMEVIKEFYKWFNIIPVEKQKQIKIEHDLGSYLLQSCDRNLNLDIYKPELYSGYRIMNNSYQLLRKSSYNPIPKYKKTHNV